jgi:hypothetical protein
LVSIDHKSSHTQTTSKKNRTVMLTYMGWDLP